MGKMLWPDDRASRLVELVNGPPIRASTIANILSEEFGAHISKCSVISKLSRLGLKVRPQPGVPSRPDQQRARPRSLPQKKSHPYTPKKTKALPPATIDGTFEHRCTLRDLADGRCHWPVGDPQREDFFYCGAPTVGDCYCAG